jgi:hypothetical protein
LKKTIDTVVEDIYDVFRKPHVLNEDNLEEFAQSMKDAIKVSIQKASEKRTPTLRMSNIGKPDRQLWFELTYGKTVDDSVEDTGEFVPLEGSQYIKFLFGDLIEQLLVFLIKEAGHTVAHRQEEVDIDGVLGHTDGTVDGVVTDYKSASGYQFRTKFANRGLLKPGQENDPFGYRGQLSGYREKLAEKYPNDIEADHAAWIVFNKETGEIILLKVDIMELINAEDRVRHLKNVLSKDTPPVEKCYSDVADGDNGNRVLHKSCTYCPFKGNCWTNLRVFKYANGPKYFTKVNKLPRVEEVTDAIF